jgi:predicted ATP-dependent protease
VQQTKNQVTIRLPKLHSHNRIASVLRQFMYIESREGDIAQQNRPKAISHNRIARRQYHKGKSYEENTSRQQQQRAELSFIMVTTKFFLYNIPHMNKFI